MSRYCWTDCPVGIKTQIRGFTQDLVTLFGSNLVGVYLHGSLAMGCFNPRASDLDLLAIIKRHLPLSTKRQLAELLLRVSRAPQQIEVSVLSLTDLVPWQYPTPFDFHYGETWREQIQQDLESGRWQHWNEKIARDPDLAVHVTITKHRGIRILGVPIPQVFPDVPKHDYLASIAEDVTSVLEGVQDDPIYSILNVCRVYAFLQDGLICSKQEGGQWALTFVPEELRLVMARALESYATTSQAEQFGPVAVAMFASYMQQHLFVER